MDIVDIILMPFICFYLGIKTLILSPYYLYNLIIKGGKLWIIMNQIKTKGI